MQKLLQQIDVRMITAAGGILLAGFLSYVLYSVLTNDLSHINESIKGTTEVQKETNLILRQNAEVQGRVLEVIRDLRH